MTMGAEVELEFAFRVGAGSSKGYKESWLFLFLLQEYGQQIFVLVFFWRC